MQPGDQTQPSLKSVFIQCYFAREVDINIQKCLQLLAQVFTPVFLVSSNWNSDRDHLLFLCELYFLSRHYPDCSDSHFSTSTVCDLAVLEFARFGSSGGGVMTAGVPVWTSIWK